MEQIECSKTPANINQMPGKHTKENTLKDKSTVQPSFFAGSHSSQKRNKRDET
jgi:hypothetical protein